MILASQSHPESCLTQAQYDYDFFLIFNRYVADIFLPKNQNETDLQKVADFGIYLNQLLLERGLAEVF